MDGSESSQSMKGAEDHEDEVLFKITQRIESSPHPVEYIEISRGKEVVLSSHFYEVASEEDFHDRTKPDGFLSEWPVFERSYRNSDWNVIPLNYRPNLEYNIKFNEAVVYCSRCSFNMFYDEKLEEFYCPCCDEESKWSWKKQYFRKTFIEDPYTWIHDRFAS